MGGGGGGHTTSTGTTYTANMPEWMKDPHKELVAEAQRFWYETEAPQYGESRIEGWSPAEVQARQAREQMFLGGDPYGDRARQMAELGSQIPGQVQRVETDYQGIGGIADDPRFANRTHEGTTHSFSESPYADRGPREYDFGSFGGAEASKYMNPYWRNVVKQQEDAARDQFARGRMGTEAQRVASGSRGGYRAALEDMLGRSEEAETIADIRGRGAKSAYESAQQQYERDRSAAMGAATMGQESLRDAQSRFEAERQAEITGAGMTEESLMNAQNRMEQDRQAYLRAAQMGDQSGMQAAKMRLDADRYNADMLMKQAQFASDQAKLYSGLGKESSDAARTRITDHERAGASEREMFQRIRDEQYADWARQQGWQQQQMNWYGSLLSGAPGVVPASQYEKRPAPSFASQMAGFGLGAAGLKGMFK